MARRPRRMRYWGGGGAGTAYPAEMRGPGGAASSSFTWLESGREKSIVGSNKLFSNGASGNAAKTPAFSFPIHSPRRRMVHRPLLSFCTCQK